jgi:hypothetical protein
MLINNKFIHNALQNNQMWLQIWLKLAILNTPTTTLIIKPKNITINRKTSRLIRLIWCFF